MASLNVSSVKNTGFPIVSRQDDSDENILPLDLLPEADPMAIFVKNQTSDKICHELALECDRLNLLLVSSYNKKVRKVSEVASLIAKRVSTLKLLGERLESIQDKEEATLEVSAMARVVRIVKDVLRESSIAPETREIVFQTLLDRVSIEVNDKR